MSNEFRVQRAACAQAIGIVMQSAQSKRRVLPTLANWLRLQIARAQVSFRLCCDRNGEVSAWCITVSPTSNDIADVHAAVNDGHRPFPHIPGQRGVHVIWSCCCVISSATQLVFSLERFDFDRLQHRFHQLPFMHCRHVLHYLQQLTQQSPTHTSQHTFQCPLPGTSQCPLTLPPSAQHFPFPPSPRPGTCQWLGFRAVPWHCYPTSHIMFFMLTSPKGGPRKYSRDVVFPSSP